MWTKIQEVEWVIEGSYFDQIDCFNDFIKARGIGKCLEARPFRYSKYHLTRLQRSIYKIKEQYPQTTQYVI